MVRRRLVSFVVSLAAGVALSAIGAAAIAGLTSLSTRVDWSPVIVAAMLPIPIWLGLPIAAIALGNGIARLQNPPVIIDESEKRENSSDKTNKSNSEANRKNPTHS